LKIQPTNYKSPFTARIWFSIRVVKTV